MSEEERKMEMIEERINEMRDCGNGWVRKRGSEEDGDY